jgi:cytochrome P450
MDSRELGNAIVDTATYVSDSAYDALFARLRKEEPVSWAEPDGYRPFWVVTKHADIRSVEVQQTRFVNAPRTFLISQSDETRLLQAQQAGITPMGRSVVQIDGDEHRALRGVTHLWFAPANVKSIQEKIRHVARDAIDEMLVHQGKCDFVRDVALWYPLRVIMLILGLPREDEKQLLKLTQTTFAPNDPDTDGSPGVAGMIEASQVIGEYFRAVTDDRRRIPRADVASVIANALVDGVPISEVDAAAYYLTIITAGHDTTSSTTAGGLLALLQHPEQFDKLRSGAASVDSAVGEFLRWVTPIKHFFRTAMEDCSVGGKAIKAGDSLMMCYPSGNRDADVFHDPFSFRVDRAPNPQLAFGYGPHVCLGQHLAKLEMRIFFEELLSRVDGISLAGEPALTASNFVQGLKQLPISFSPKRIPA